MVQNLVRYIDTTDDEHGALAFIYYHSKVIFKDQARLFYSTEQGPVQILLRLVISYIHQYPVADFELVCPQIRCSTGNETGVFSTKSNDLRCKNYQRTILQQPIDEPRTVSWSSLVSGNRTHVPRDWRGITAQITPANQQGLSSSHESCPVPRN